MSDELLPCPHEHGQRVLGLNVSGTASGNAPRWYVSCLDCGARGPEAGTHQSAIAAWNRRSQPAPIEPETDPTAQAGVTISDAMVEAAARAIYAALPNFGMEWRPNTRGGSSQTRVDDAWEDAPDRHEDCRRQARAALEAALAAQPAQTTEAIDPAAIEAVIRRVLNVDTFQQDRTYLVPSLVTALVAYLDTHAATQAVVTITEAVATAPPSTGAEGFKKHLREHWLVSVGCDHGAETNTGTCSCSQWQDETHSSVGACVDAWIEHVFATFAPAPQEQASEREAVIEECAKVLDVLAAEHQGKASASMQEAKQANYSGQAMVLRKGAAAIRSLARPRTAGEGAP